MQLIDINKSRYRKHLNYIIAGFISSLLVLSLVFGQLLIASFEQEGVSNFRYNLLGVILALLACAAILHSIKKSDFFKEAFYVWELKQIQNLIYRKLKIIKNAAKNDETEAITILLFYYQSLQQVYELDDNTLTIASVQKELNEIQETITNKNLTINSEQFTKNLLNSYR